MLCSLTSEWEKEGNKKSRAVMTLPVRQNIAVLEKEGNLS
jgi:hypothetical protein